MRTIGLVAIAMMGLGLSGCSQVSSVFKKKPHYHTSDGTAVYTSAEANLRTTPQQSYQFDQDSYDVDVYDASSQYASPQYASSQYSGSQYAGYEVELYNSQPSYSAPVYSDPREAEFVMLNGESKLIDWQNCEIMNQGYLYVSEYDFSLNPGFEVCMRNKGYVLTTEYGPNLKQTVSARAARLRGPVEFTQPSSSYPGYFR